MKKILTLFVICCMAILIFVGCKKKENSEAMNNVTPEAAATSAPIDTPTAAATSAPIDTPTAAPTAIPTAAPTIAPTAAPTTVAETAPVYKDGVYEVQTPTDNEGYYVTATVTVEGGKITAADWMIYDQVNDAPFDGEYYKIFEEQNALPVYVQQAKDDWAGSRGYADALIETQDATEVDAVSAATWACNEFKKAILMALKDANAE